MALGKYHIQIQYDFDPPQKWRTDLQMQYMGKEFAKGAFFVLKNLSGGNRAYRLVKCDHAPRDNSQSVEVLDMHNTGAINLNSSNMGDI